MGKPETLRPYRPPCEAEAWERGESSQCNVYLGSYPPPGPAWHASESHGARAEDAPLSEAPAGVTVSWESDLPVLLNSFSAFMTKRMRGAARMDTLERAVLLLGLRCEELERHQPTTVPIQSLAPEPYEVVRRIDALVRRSGDSFVASFADANIGASGDTFEEALENLKDMLVVSCEMLYSLSDERLGPEPQHQKAVLREFIRQRE
jgi:hypothetical protein